MIRQYELVERVKAYDPHADENLLNRAYVFSMKAHGTQVRASGDPFFSHPLEVAGILTEMKLDSDTIVTALLHDTIEDTVATKEEIAELFGSKIADLVDGVTKLSRIELQTESERQAENFRKFLLAISNDIRVLLIKLADRLHNMRTLHHIDKPEKRQRIARETVEVYAPLAERIGMRDLKDELDDIAFRELNPEAYESIAQRLKYLRSKGGRASKSIARAIRSTLKKQGIVAEAVGREKSPNSIWKKMESKHVPFEQLADVMAFRVIVPSIDECYKALGIIHRTWSMIPGRFKDYISTPKRNGYQSIHTTVIGPRQIRIEIQIRTPELDQIAERGVAAHWQYKQNSKDVDGSQYTWVRDLLEILEQASSPEEFLENTRLAMFQDQVFCFTPNGDLISLPRGSTPVDFAYSVHTAVGDSCVGATVNGRVVPLRYELQNGDQVEIVRSKAQKPSPRWEGFVVTGKARSAIRRFVRQKEMKEYVSLGRALLKQSFKREGLGFKEGLIKDSLEGFKYNGLPELYADIGRGLLHDRQVLKSIFPSIKFKVQKHPLSVPVSDWEPEDSDRHAIPIEGLTPGVAVHLSECCLPLPGDRIVGLVSPGRGIEIHTSDCENLGTDIEDNDNWLNVSWHGSGAKSGVYAGRLKLVVVNEAGALAQIAAVVAKQDGNISNLKIAHRDTDFFTFLVDVEVRDLKHLTSVLTALRTLSVISTADRLKSGDPEGPGRAEAA